MVICDKCKNDHPGHNCNRFVDYLLLDDAATAYLIGLPHGTIICEAIWDRCDGTCVWPAVCKGHIECQCMDRQGNEFMRVLTMNNASNLIWKTKLRIYRIKDEEVKRINRVKSFKPSIMAEECEDKGIPLTEEAWNQACINALIEGEKPQDRRKEMPFYEYECPVCKAILETVLPCPAPDNLKRKCYFCEEVREYKRIMSAPAIVKVK